MKAVVYEKYGPPEVLQIKEIDKPIPKDHEVLIKIHASTVSVADFRMRSFTVPPSFYIPARLALGIRGPRNKILGMELSGEIVETGKKVTKFKKGDQVFGGSARHHFGAYAEYKCMPENSLLTLKPENLNFEAAAAVPLGGRTALYFLKAGRIQKGQKVLIYGASGSVGSYAVQLAKYFETEVTAVCSTRNMEWVKHLGADKVLDYTREDFTQNGIRYDIIFDTVGKTSLSKVVKCLHPGGYFLHAVATPAIMVRLRLLGARNRIHVVGGGPSFEIDHLLFLKKLVEEGKIKPIIDKTYAMENIVEAHRYVEQGHKRGNVVITIP